MKIRCWIFGHQWEMNRLGCRNCDLTAERLDRKPPMFGLGISVAPPLRLYLLRWWAKPYTREGERYTFNWRRRHG